jgi:ATP-dependent Clp protease adapter protein ClpS
MFGLLRQKLSAYFERNEKAHALARYEDDSDEISDRYSVLPLLLEIDQGLERFSGQNLCVLEIFNDDTTPMEYVIYVIERFSKRDRVQATKLALKVHGTGSGHIAAGGRSILEAIAKLIEQDATARQYPFKCAVRAV